MTNTVLILAISIILVSVTFIPLAEAVVSWNGFLKQVGFNPPTIYEVSGVSVIEAGTGTGSLVQLRCLEGDTFIDGERNTVLSLDPSKSFPVQRTDFIQVQENDPNIASTSGRVIGADVRASQNGGIPTFDVPVTITGLCLSPSSLMSVGGEWQATDTTALIIGYSVLNAYWLAPLAIGIGAGIYLTRNRLQKH